MNPVRDCIFNVLSKCPFIGEDSFIIALGVADDISLMIIEGNVENLVPGINNLRVVLVQLLYLENLQKEEAAKRMKS